MSGQSVACKSDYEAFRSPQYCCKGDYGNPNIYKPSAYSQFFKNACPGAYSYAFTCAIGGGYAITFCTMTTSQKAGKSPDATAGLSTSLINDTMMYLSGDQSKQKHLLVTDELIEMLSNDPVLRGIKLITEAWDAGLYQVGTFPYWSIWSDGMASFATLCDNSSKALMDFLECSYWHNAHSIFVTGSQYRGMCIVGFGVMNMDTGNSRRGKQAFLQWASDESIGTLSSRF